MRRKRTIYLFIGKGKKQARGLLSIEPEKGCDPLETRGWQTFRGQGLQGLRLQAGDTPHATTAERIKRQKTGPRVATGGPTQTPRAQIHWSGQLAQESGWGLHRSPSGRSSLARELETDLRVSRERVGSLGQSERRRHTATSPQRIGLDAFPEEVLARSRRGRRPYATDR